MSFHLKKDNRLAELVGIILGDGHLNLNYERSIYTCEIALNYVDEREYVYYVKDLLESLFNIKPTLTKSKRDKGIIVRLNRKAVVEALISIGLLPGDKVQNQVSVPNWIKKDLDWINNNQKEWEIKYKPLVIACVRGLMDTDGTIYVNWYKEKNYLSIGIGFTSGSLPLVRDFKEMCKTIGINTSKISEYEGISQYGQEYTAYSTSTEAKDQVYKFIIDVVKPFKWKIKQESIKQKLKKHNTTIEEIFEYQRPYRPYNKEWATYLKELFEKLGSFQYVRDYLIKIGEKPIKRETISKLIHTLLNEQGESFEKWKSLNSGIFLDNNVVGEIRLPLEVKKMICRAIYNIIIKESFNITNLEILERLKNAIDNSDLKRIAFLLNNENSKEIVLEFLKASIYLMKYLLNFIDEWKTPTKIRNDILERYGILLPFHDSHIKEIMKDIYIWIK